MNLENNGENYFQKHLENDLFHLVKVLSKCILHHWYLKEIVSFNMLFANCLPPAIHYSPTASLSLFAMLQFAPAPLWWWWDTGRDFFSKKSNFPIESKQKTYLPLSKSTVTIMLAEPSSFRCCSIHKNVFNWIGMYSLKNLNDMKVCTWNKVPIKPHSFHSQSSSTTPVVFWCASLHPFLRIWDKLE